MSARASVVTALLLVLSLSAVLLPTGCDPAPAGGSPGASPSDDGDASTAGFPTPPARRFVDITQESGISFLHRTGGTGEKLLPETMGSGCALLDYDGDGVLDVFLVNSGVWPDRPLPDDPPRCALYRGRGDGTFEDVTDRTGAGIALYGMGCAVADVEGDGDPDILVTALGENVYLRNDGGTFTDATAEAGLAGGTWRMPTVEEGTRPDWSTAAAWFDADGDRDLDLFVANYVAWDRTLEIFTSLDGRTKAFTTPDRYEGLPCRLFLQTSPGRFTEKGDAAGVSRALGKALGVALWDFDDDGGLEVVVANDTRPNFYFDHRGAGRFEERGLELGIAYDEAGRARAGMGIDIGVTGDGSDPEADAPTIAIGNFAEEPITFARRMPHGGFAFREGAAGLRRATTPPLAFAVEFADLDLDGILDLVIVNGHIEPEVVRFFPGQSHAQSVQIFHGGPDGRFAEVGASLGPDLVSPRVGRGLAVGDIDGDGDLDLLVTTNGGPPALLRNDRLETGDTAGGDTAAGNTAAGNTAGHFVRIRLRGNPPNTDAIGARVTLRAGGRTQVRTARTGSSYLSSGEPTLTFGLGDATTVERCTVRWPSGRTEEVAIAGVDRTVELREPSGD